MRLPLYIRSRNFRDTVLRRLRDLDDEYADAHETCQDNLHPPETEGSPSGAVAVVVEGYDAYDDRAKRLRGLLSARVSCRSR